MATFKVRYAVVNMELSDVVEASDETAAISIIRNCAMKIDAIRSVERIAGPTEIMAEEFERRAMDAFLAATA